MKGQKLERPFRLDMAFGEALARYVQTAPEEVDPPSGRKAKGARPKPGAPETTGGDEAAAQAAGTSAREGDP